MKSVGRFLRAILLVLASPFLLLLPWLALSLLDLVWLVLGRRRVPTDTYPKATSASVVIPNWNGRDLLEKYLPSVLAAMSGHPANEIIVVDNASEDGSAEYLRQAFPNVKVVQLETNRGFGGGSNAGFRAATNDIVVLLNSDMRVERDFLAPLLAGFTDEKVFSVSCQIFFSDPAKLREETGLTQAWWEGGSIRVRHRLDDDVNDLFPCFYGGGGSSAYDRRKFLELGGFDELLAPFYMEDTDLGMLAWKRGWKVLYQPASIVYHEHRGTIGKKFSPEFIRGIIRKNFLLFAWKNIHEPARLASSFTSALVDVLLTLLFNDSRDRADAGALWRAVRQTRMALRSRWLARELAVVTDTEAFRRPMGGYYRDRFGDFSSLPGRLQVLFVTPYPLCPPVHGGAVFMNQTVKALSRHCDVHLIALLDRQEERAAHQEMDSICASTGYLYRSPSQRAALGSLTPFAVREFRSADLDWAIHRRLLTERIDVLQLEYTQMGQYAGDYRRIVTALFEHDVYFQSIARGLSQRARPAAIYEYLRALRFEISMLSRIDHIQVCTEPNRAYLAGFVPSAKARIHAGLRAGIDTSLYRLMAAGREPFTMLFIGSFRHLPNQAALMWFVNQVLPRVRAQCPKARLVVAGSDTPPEHAFAGQKEAVELLGFVEDVRGPLARYAVFVCPILSGSGVRVKLLEAFAAGIPAVSTRIGAEGLATVDGEICRLADHPQGFADAILQLFDDATQAAEMSGRARCEVEALWDSTMVTERLVTSYVETAAAKRVGATRLAASHRR
jgi:GT2 family glycosyltransferase